MVTHASLFSGIGGFDLAAEWAGWTNMFNCEIDPFCRRVLKYHFPNAVQYEDIKTTDFTVWRGRIDVLTGGFPCQPFSVAGKRKGTDDDRYLWPEMLRAIREISPRWVVGENVRGFVNWSDGMVLDTVFADLEALGYEVQPFILPACAVDAPHRRDRVWIIAHRADARSESVQERTEQANGCEAVANTESIRFRRSWCGGERESDKHSIFSRKCKGREVRRAIDRPCGEPPAADTTRTRLSALSIAGGIDSEEREVANRCIVQPARDARRTLQAAAWQHFPTQPPVCGGDDGLPAGLDGITFPAWRRQSIKAYGNAIVPQVFYQIAETINEYENL